MKKLFTFLFFSAAALSAVAQCNPAITSGTYVLTVSQSDHGISDSVWICSGVTDTTNNINGTYFLEVGATFYGTNGIGNTAYVPRGATAKFDGPALSNTIYFVDSSDVIYVYSYNVNLIQCASIAYDYTNAPEPGCSITTGVADKNSVISADIYPNTSSGKFVLKISGVQKTSFTVDVFNLLGNKLKQLTAFANSENQINLSSLPRGMYFVKVNIGERQVIKKIIIQ